MEVEAQMRRYMLDRRCSLALLVTPERTRIYRDTYADYTEATVQFVGEFSTADLLEAGILAGRPPTARIH